MYFVVQTPEGGRNNKFKRCAYRQVYSVKVLIKIVLIQYIGVKKTGLLWYMFFCTRETVTDQVDPVPKNIIHSKAIIIA